MQLYNAIVTHKCNYYTAMFKGKEVRVLFRLGLSLTIKRDSKSLREFSLLAVPTIVKFSGVTPCEDLTQCSRIAEYLGLPKRLSFAMLRPRCSAILMYKGLLVEPR